MAWQRTPGSGLWLPTIFGNISAGHSTSLTATNQYLGFYGRIGWSDGASSKNLQGVSFRFTTVTKGSGSITTLRVSLQNINTSISTLPPTPDGIVLRSFTIANDHPNFISNSVIPFTNFDSVFPINIEQPIYVVFDLPTFTAGDNVTISNVGGGLVTQEGRGVHWNGTALAGQLPPNLLFRADDGILGTFNTGWAFPFISAATEIAMSQNECGLRYKLPYAHKIDGIWFTGRTTDTTPVIDVNIYDGVQSLHNFYAGRGWMIGTPHLTWLATFPESPELEADHVYRVVIRGTPNAPLINVMDVPTNEYFSIFPGGREMHWTQRPIAGTTGWTDNNARRPIMGFRISSLLDDTPRVHPTFARTPGTGMWMPPLASGPGFWFEGILTANSAAMLTTMMGRAFWTDGASTKTIQSASFRFGGAIRTNGSSLRVSLQNQLSPIPAFPARPDGTVLTSFIIQNSDTNWAANSVYPLTPFDTPLTVTFGQPIALVIDWNAFFQGDQYIIHYVTGAITSQSNFVGGVGAGNAQVTNAIGTNVLFQCTDGSYASLDSHSPLPFASLTGTTAVANGGEAALCYRLPYPHKIDGVGVSFTTTTVNGQFEINIYDETSLLLSRTFATAGLTTAGQTRPFTISFPEIEMEANKVYYVALRAITSTTISVANHDVLPDNGVFSLFPGGQNFFSATRPNTTSAWVGNATRRVLISVRVSSLDNGRREPGGGNGGGTNIFLVED
jgi:hypothetical protein